MRIAVAHILQESNTFSPVPTRLEDFRLTDGRDVIGRWKGLKTEMGGFLDVLEREGWEAAPVLAGWAITAGPILAREFAKMQERLAAALRKAQPFDGMLFALHGAMCAEGTDDCEGALLNTVREVVGQDIPVFVSLDLHANVTALMTLADCMVGYKTYPHVDMYETGVKTAELLVRTLKKEITPVTAFMKLPLIVPAENMQTTHGPMAEVFRCGADLAKASPEVLDVSVFGVQPWLDIEEMGGAAVVVCDWDEAMACDYAARVAQRFWDLRHEFEVELLSPEAAIREALATEGGPVVLAESSDSTGSGSPGDSADLVEAILQHGKDAPAAAWVRDPAAATAAHMAGTGATLNLSIGGAFDKVHRRPVALEAIVESISAGEFIYQGGWNHGMKADMGTTAVLRSGNTRIVVCERSVMTVDPELYRSQGIEPRDQKIVVVKSPNGFRSEYEPIAARIILADTPGVASANLQLIPWRRLARPIYPLDEISFSAHGGMNPPE